MIQQIQYYLKGIHQVSLTRKEFSEDRRIHNIWKERRICQNVIYNNRAPLFMYGPWVFCTGGKQKHKWLTALQREFWFEKGTWKINVSVL